MSQIKAQPRWAPGQNSEVTKAMILLPGNGANNSKLNACIEQMGDFIGNGKTGCPAIHIEAVRKNNPMARWVFRVQFNTQGLITSSTALPNSRTLCVISEQEVTIALAALMESNMVMVLPFFASTIIFTQNLETFLS
jgi:hypothetical protein